MRGRRCEELEIVRGFSIFLLARKKAAQFAKYGEEGCAEGMRGRYARKFLTDAQKYSTDAQKIWNLCGADSFISLYLPKAGGRRRPHRCIDCALTPARLAVQVAASTCCPRTMPSSPSPATFFECPCSKRAFWSRARRRTPWARNCWLACG